MRRLLVGVSALMMMATVAGAQTTQPTTQPQPGGPRRMGQRMGMSGLTQEERTEAEVWSRDHMPNLHKLLIAVPPSPRRGRLFRIAAARMHALQQTKDPAAADKLAKNIHDEDDVFALVVDLDQAPATDKPAIREKIHKKISDTVEALLDERADRIDKLRTKLDDEETKLEQDRANKDKLVQAQLENFMVDSPSPTGIMPDGKDAPQPTINAMEAPPDNANGK